MDVTGENSFESLIGKIHGDAGIYIRNKLHLQGFFVVAHSSVDSRFATDRRKGGVRVGELGEGLVTRLDMISDRDGDGDGDRDGDEVDTCSAERLVNQEILSQQPAGKNFSSGMKLFLFAEGYEERLTYPSTSTSTSTSIERSKFPLFFLAEGTNSVQTQY